MNSYYIDDGYFDTIIQSYFNDKPNWKRVYNKQLANITLFHANFEQHLYCKIGNGFSDLSCIGNKRLLYNNIANFYNKKGRNIPSYLPVTYSFSNTNYNKCAILFTSAVNYWIIKPEHGMRQEAVTVIKNYQQLQHALVSYSGYKDWIIQRYIHNPLLYKGKKFHFRVYALLYKNKTTLNAYVYKSGYMYIADSIYNLYTISNKDSHITSSCNNIEFPSGFDEMYGINKFNTIIYPQIKRIVADSIRATSIYIKSPLDKCYKMIAYDIIPDENFNVYLMEVNSRVIGMASADIAGNCKSKNPSLQTVGFKTTLMRSILDLVLNINHNTDLLERVYTYSNIPETFSGNGVYIYIPLLIVLLIVVIIK